MILTKRIRLRIILLLLLLLFAITAAQAADAKQTRLPDYDDDDNFEGTLTDGQWRDKHSVTASNRRGSRNTKRALLQVEDDRRSSSTTLRFSGRDDDDDNNNSRAAAGKSLRMAHQSVATTNAVDNLKSFVPILQQANLTAIQEQQQNLQESYLSIEKENSSISEHRNKQQQVQNVSLMIGGLAIAVGSSIMTFFLGTTTTTITASFPHFRIMSPSLAILPWMWSLRKHPTTGGFLLELMAVAELVAQQPAWYYAQAKVALSLGFNVLLQFIIWELWRQVWRFSGRLFLNQVFHRHHSTSQKGDGNQNDENFWNLPMWLQRSIDYADATLRRGAKKWLQKSVERTVEAHAVSWFFWLGEVMTLSLW